MKPSLRSNSKNHLSCNMFRWFAVYSVLDYFLGQHVVLNNLVEQPGLGGEFDKHLQFYRIEFTENFVVVRWLQLSSFAHRLNSQKQRCFQPSDSPTDKTSIWMNWSTACHEKKTKAPPSKKERTFQWFGGFWWNCSHLKQSEFWRLLIEIIFNSKKSSRCYRTYNLIHYQQ